MRRAPALALVAAVVVVAATALQAGAALRQVAVGNFYFDDDTPGDGRVEANQGDQLRFVVQDGGPGTPHTVEVDELGIHSGSLAAGETFTTPPLDKPGTFRLYCKPHDQRGHVATLVVRSASTSSTAPPTTAAPRGTVSPTTTTSGGSSGSTSQTQPGAATPTTEASSPTTAAPGGGLPASTDPATGEALAPAGRGEATAQELEGPAAPDSLEAMLGREPARPGPWTRSVRLGVLLLLPMLLIAVAAVLRSRTRGTVRPDA